MHNNNNAPLSIVSEDEWGDLECQQAYKACQAAQITDGGLFTENMAYMNEVKMNNRVKMTEMKPLARSRGQRTD